MKVHSNQGPGLHVQNVNDPTAAYNSRAQVEVTTTPFLCLPMLLRMFHKITENRSRRVNVKF